MANAANNENYHMELPASAHILTSMNTLVLSIVKRLTYADFQKPMTEMIVNSKGEISIVKS